MLKFQLNRHFYPLQMCVAVLMNMKWVDDSRTRSDAFFDRLYYVTVEHRLYLSEWSDRCKQPVELDFIHNFFEDEATATTKKMMIWMLSDPIGVWKRDFESEWFN